MISSEPYVTIRGCDGRSFIRQVQEAVQSPFDWIVLPELIPSRGTPEIRQAVENLFNTNKHIVCALGPRYQRVLPVNVPLFLVQCDTVPVTEAVFLIRGYMFGVSAGEIRQLEHTAISCGIPERAMIENAARAVVEVIEARIPLDKNRDLVTVLAGTGNNGADALVTARNLISMGYRVSIFVLRLQGRYSAGLQEVLASCIQLGIPISVVEASEDSVLLRKAIGVSKLIIDGIFGIGFHGTMPLFHAKIIGQVNLLAQKKKARVLAIDIPSGISADGGKNGCAVRAEYTVTFFAEKKGFYFPNAFDCCGKIFVKDIGVNRQMLSRV